MGTSRSVWVVLGALIPPLALYYLVYWLPPSQWSLAIDHCELLFCDFVRHYHVMGRVMLDTARPVPGYFYSAFFALLLVPFGLMPESVALWAWGAVQLVTTALLLALSLRVSGASRPSSVVSCVALCLTSLPLLHNLKWGQVSVPITACILAAFLAHARQRRVQAGTWLAFAASIKLYPAWFLAHFLARRDGRAVTSFAVAGLLFFALLPSVILGPHDWLAFERAVRPALEDASWIHQDDNSQYIVHVGQRWAHHLFPSLAGRAWAVALKAAGFVLAGANLALVWWLGRRVPSEPAFALAALLLAIPFLLETSWPHYFVYLPFCQTLILDRLLSASGSRRGWVVAGWIATGASIALASVFAVRPLLGWARYTSGGALFFANALLLGPLYALAWCGVEQGSRSRRGILRAFWRAE